MLGTIAENAPAHTGVFGTTSLLKIDFPRQPVRAPLFFSSETIFTSCSNCGTRVNGRSLAIAAAEIAAPDGETATLVTVVEHFFDDFPLKNGNELRALASRGRRWPPTEFGLTGKRCASGRVTGYLT